MTAYYNENDPFAAQWLRNLIAANLIAAGDVDDRSIADVGPDDLLGYSQCHFFAGIGIWSHALRAASWPDDRPVWTGSCPCQPFSAAGRGAGFADPRHLWPVWQRLIAACGPVAILGEQVDGPAGRAWWDVVQTNLEASGYACGQVVLCSAGVGAPNIRHRRFWLAHANGGQRGRLTNGAGCEQRRAAAGRQQGNGQFEQGGVGSGGLVHPQSRGRGEHGLLGEAGGVGQAAGQSAQPNEAAGRLGHAGHPRLPHPEPRDLPATRRRGEGRAITEPSGPHDPWRELEWIECLDGKLRPVPATARTFESEIFGLVAGPPAGVERSGPGWDEEAPQAARIDWDRFPLAPRALGDTGRLRAYGNAINAVLAREFIAAAMEVIP